MASHQNGHLRSGSLNIPPHPNGHHPPPPHQLPGAPAGRFDQSRSPPNTRHVPCKFFRQGACQAGSACPFSHDLESASETICKYFAKGNCRFGPKCANIHVLPDGRRINYSKNGVTFGNPPVGAAMSPRSGAPTASNLTNSFLSGREISAYGQNGAEPHRGFTSHPSDESMRQENGIPIHIDGAQSYAHDETHYGSPLGTDARIEMGLSPVNKGLSAIDAPLPASFDPNAVSHVAQYPNGPFPSSVPNQFGLSSPSQSLKLTKDGVGVHKSDTLRMLHSSAFGSGSNDHLSPNTIGASGLSPPSSDAHRRAAMHSMSRTGLYPQSVMSASVPKSVPKTSRRGVDGDWDNHEFVFNNEEDCLPDTLNDLLTPTEKARRGSLRADDHDSPSGPHASNHTGSGIKFGSPIPTSSPSSRWGPGGWGAEADDKNGRPRYGASPFGHVGSPLRNSSLVGSDLNSTAAGHARPNGPPSRRGTGSNESLSALTQQLRRTGLEGDSMSGGSSPRLRSMNGSSSSRAIGSEREKNTIERHVSSGSIGSSRLASKTIDEEDEAAFLFTMDVEDSSRSAARKSGGSGGYSAWNYTNAVPGGRIGANNGGGSSASGNVHVGSSREPRTVGR